MPLRIIYRVYLIFQKPVEELEEVLGVDIPPTPDVTLSTITDTTIVLFWKPPENYHSPMDRYIQVNGIRSKPSNCPPIALLILRRLSRTHSPHQPDR